MKQDVSQRLFFFATLVDVYFSICHMKLKT